jgi:hypothetical protein
VRALVGRVVCDASSIGQYMLRRFRLEWQWLEVFMGGLLVLERANIGKVASVGENGERDLSDMLVVMTASSVLNSPVLRVSLVIPLV